MRRKRKGEAPSSAQKKKEGWGTVMQVEKIYFDMDGVLADFERGVIEKFGLQPLSPNAKHRGPNQDEQMWMAIKQRQHFYDELELLPDAKELFDALYKKYGDRVEILTGIPKPKRGIACAAADKEKWVRRMLSDDVKINTVFREEKPQYCTGKGCILIDDMEENVESWIAMGGTGIVHVDAKNTMDKLRELDVL